MFASIGDRILALPAGLALFLVFLLPALESSVFLGFVFPGEIAVIVGGVLASQGKFPLWMVIAAAVIGAVLGDSIGYEVGRHWGDRILRGSVGRLPIIRGELDRHLESAKSFVRRRGPHSVFVGRFTTALRVLVPGLAGMAGLPYPQFLLFNVLGAVCWGTAFVLLGYFAGQAWERFAADASHVGLALLAVVFLVLVSMRVFRRAREKGTLSADHLASLRLAAWFRGRYPRLSAWLALRVDPASTRGLALSLAAVGGGVLLWSYGALAQDVLWDDDLVLRDAGITSWVVAHRTDALTSVMRWMTDLGSVAFLVPAIVVFGLWFRWRRGSFVPLLQLGAVFVITCGLAAVTKEAVERPRPPVGDLLVPTLGWSFPSLHTAGAAAVFAMAGVLVARRWGARVGIVLVATVAVALVAWSRVYLGASWFTDVLAGAALGGAVVLGAVSLSLWTRAESVDRVSATAEVASTA